MLERLGFKNKQKQKAIEIQFGPAVVHVSKESCDKLFLRSPIEDTKLNLEYAKEQGIEPVSLRAVFEQINASDIPNIVLFDSPHIAGLVGNHWRILEINKEDDSAELQLCGPFGTYDLDDLPPVNVSLAWHMFTGLSILHPEIEGTPVTLSEVGDLFRDQKDTGNSISFKDETILWSNAQGQLVPLSSLRRE